MDSVVHFEMAYDDRERVARFYESAFGWRSNILGPETGHYVIAETTETDENQMVKSPGAINGGFFERKAAGPHHHPSVVISVENLGASMDKVKRAGGEVLGEPIEIPGIGQYVAFRDTEGNRVGMLQPVPMNAAR